MITNSGKTYFKNYLAGRAAVPSHIALGISDTAASASDTKLGFEVSRLPIEYIGYDFNADKIVYRALTDDVINYSAYEVGLITDQDYVFAEGMLVSTFDSSDIWTGTSTFTTSNTRIGPDSLRHAPAANSTLTSGTEFQVDMSEFSSNDVITAAFYVGNVSHTLNVKIRFHVDSSNYYEFTRTSFVSGFNYPTFTKGSATTTGTPNWSNIQYVEVSTTSTTTGTSCVIDWNGLRVDPAVLSNTQSGLIARDVIAATSVLSAAPVGIEYRQSVTF